MKTSEWEDKIKYFALEVTKRLGGVRCNLEFFCVPYKRIGGLIVDTPMLRLRKGDYSFNSPFRVSITCFNSLEKPTAIQIIGSELQASDRDLQELTNACINY